MKFRSPYYFVVLFVASLVAIAACSSGGDEVEDAPPAEMPEESEETGGDEEIQDSEDEAGADSDERKALLDAFSKMDAIDNAEIRMECQCEYSMLGYETEDECTVEHVGGVADLEEQAECIAEGLDSVGEPAPVIYEYFGCMSEQLDTGLQCVEDDLETGNCDRVDDIYTVSWLDACLEPHTEEFNACESILYEADDQATDWMFEIDEMMIDCLQGRAVEAK